MKEELIRQYEEYVYNLKKDIKSGLIVVKKIPTIKEYYPNIEL